MKKIDFLRNLVGNCDEYSEIVSTGYDGHSYYYYHKGAIVAVIWVDYSKDKKNVSIKFKSSSEMTVEAIKTIFTIRYFKETLIGWKFDNWKNYHQYVFRIRMNTPWEI